jgi:predicted transcriptional regulator
MRASLLETNEKAKEFCIRKTEKSISENERVTSCMVMVCIFLAMERGMKVGSRWESEMDMESTLSTTEITMKEIGKMVRNLTKMLG